MRGAILPPAEQVIAWYLVKHNGNFTLLEVTVAFSLQIRLSRNHSGCHTLSLILEGKSYV
jgi:hypothetical protein